MTTYKPFYKAMEIPVTDTPFDGTLMVEEISVEYRKGSKNLITRAKGKTSMSLSPSFSKALNTQLATLRNTIVFPLVNQVKHNCKVIVKTDEYGNLNFNELRIEFNLDCKKKWNTHETFRIPFKVLVPFTEYIDYVNLLGHDYELSAIHAEMNVSQLDLLEVLEDPIEGPRAKAQWYAFIMEAEEEAKKEYRLDVMIPVSEGEVTWDIPYSRSIQFIENYRDTGSSL